jgi:hypothetical protein
MTYEQNRHRSSFLKIRCEVWLKNATRATSWTQEVKKTRTRIRTDGFVEPCIPSRAPKPPSGPDWVHPRSSMTATG